MKGGWALLGLLSLGSVGCAGVRPTAPSSLAPTTAPAVGRTLDSEPELPREASEALEAFNAGALQDGRVLGVPLAHADGALSLTGEPAADDRIAKVEVVGRVGCSAALLVLSTCGNVWVVGVVYEQGRWTPRSVVPVFDEARPGACQVTRAEGASRAMLTASPRELVITFASESEDGSEARDPVLRLFHLEADGAVVALGGEVALGGTDDRSGAVREGQWAIEEALALPRDLYVQIQPGRAGPGGSAPQVVIRRTYRVRGRALELVEERSLPYRAVTENTVQGGLLRPGLL